MAIHLCGYDHEDQGEMLALQTTLERELLQEEPLPMTLKRGRKPGSKVKVQKDGTRVVVTGRAAQALVQKEQARKARASEKTKTARKVRKPAPQPHRAPGRPRKSAPPGAAPPPPQRTPKPARTRSGSSLNRPSKAWSTG